MCCGQTMLDVGHKLLDTKLTDLNWSMNEKLHSTDLPCTYLAHHVLERYCCHLVLC